MVLLLVLVEPPPLLLSWKSARLPALSVLTAVALVTLYHGAGKSYHAPDATALGMGQGTVALQYVPIAGDFIPHGTSRHILVWDILHSLAGGSSHVHRVDVVAMVPNIAAPVYPQTSLLTRQLMLPTGLVWVWVGQLAVLLLLPPQAEALLLPLWLWVELLIVLMLLPSTVEALLLILHTTLVWVWVWVEVETLLLLLPTALVWVWVELLDMMMVLTPQAEALLLPLWVWMDLLIV